MLIKLIYLYIGEGGFALKTFYLLIKCPPYFIKRRPIFHLGLMIGKIRAFKILI